MEQKIGFCTSADGTRIAYATLGEGPPLVRVWPWARTLDAEFEHPEVRAHLEGLANGRMLVRFDRRGVGASQREVDDLSLEAHVADLAAVVEHLHLERFDLHGDFDACAICIAYAASHTARVGRLVLTGAYACGEDLNMRDASQDMADLFRSNWSLGRRMIASTVFPNGPVEAQRWYSGMMREGLSPETAARYVEYQWTLDVRGLLPQVQAPTLILHRRRDAVVPIGAAQDVAALIPNARFGVLDSNVSHFSFHGAEVLRLMNEFLDEGGPRRGAVAAAPVSGLVTILFTDMEGSTSLTQRLGDAKAQEVLREHNAVIRDALKTHGGSEVKHTGDGIMASFGSARGAVDCAIAIQRALALGDSVRVRIGLNAGEPVAEEHPDGQGDLFGTSVQMAARVCSQAEGGEILASNVVRELAAGKGFLFSDRGEFALKGFEEPVRLYEVRWQASD